MKIAQICTNVMSGSVGSIVRNICDGLIENGHECMIFYGRGDKPDYYNHYKFDNKLDVYSHVLFARLFDSDGLHSTIATRKLIRQLENYNPDLVHIHCLHGYYLNYPILFNYLRKSNKKIVWTMHDCWGYTGHCCYYDYVVCNKWKNECSQCPNKGSYPKSILFDKSKSNYLKKKNVFNSISKNNLTIVTPSKWLKNEIEQSFLGKYQVEVINNSVNRSIFINKYHHRKKIILGIANIWDDRKGLKDFIKLKSFLPSEWSILIVGTTEQQKQLLNKLGIESITRTKNVEDLVEIYNYSSFLFNPTYEDNYPTVNIEANLCGLPVITYNTGGASETISDGYIVEKGRLDIVESIIKGQESSNKYRKLSMREYEDMVSEYLNKYINKVGQDL